MPDVDDLRAEVVRQAARGLARPHPVPAFEAHRRRLYTEQTILSDGRTVAEFCSQSSTNVRWCSFLRRLVAGLAPATGLEIGTAAGLASLYIADGMPHGRFVTYDGWEEALTLARTTLAGSTAELREGWSDDVLPGIVAELAPIEFAFVDGSHDEDVTLWEWATIRSALADRAVVVWDDIIWSPGMMRVWAELKPQAAWTVEFGNKGVWVV